jgi:heme exporter protein B
MSTYLRLVWAIARKDLLVEFRTHERLTAMGAFVVLIGVLFNFSIDSALVRPQDIAAALISVMVALVFAVFGLFFSLQFSGNSLALLGVVSFGVLGFVSLTTLFSAMATRSSMGESLLPVLVFPLLIPVIVYGTTATDRLFAGRPVAEVSGNLRMLLAFAIIFTVAGAGLFRFVIEE